MEFRGRITIDGKGMYDYVLTPVGSEVVPPITIPKQSEVPEVRPGNGGGEIVVVTLIHHEMKTGIIKQGGRQGQPYEMHSFRASDNRKYQTFKNTEAALLTPLVGSLTPVKMFVQPNAYKSFDIKQILAD